VVSEDEEMVNFKQLCGRDSTEKGITPNPSDYLDVEAWIVPLRLQQSSWGRGSACVCICDPTSKHAGQSGQENLWEDVNFFFFLREQAFRSNDFSRTWNCILQLRSLRRTVSPYKLYNLMVVGEQREMLGALLLSGCEMIGCLIVCQRRGK
jgi:hypothetical protein